MHKVRNIVEPLRESAGHLSQGVSASRQELSRGANRAAGRIYAAIRRSRADLERAGARLTDAMTAARRNASDAVAPYRHNVSATVEDAGRYLQVAGDEIRTTAHALLERANAMPRRTLRNRLVLIAVAVGACWIVVRRVRRRRRDRTARTRGRGARTEQRRAPAKRKGDAGTERAPAQVH